MKTGKSQNANLWQYKSHLPNGEEVIDFGRLVGTETEWYWKMNNDIYHTSNNGCNVYKNEVFLGIYGLPNNYHLAKKKAEQICKMEKK